MKKSLAEAIKFDFSEFFMNAAPYSSEKDVLTNIQMVNYQRSRKFLTLLLIFSVILVTIDLLGAGQLSGFFWDNLHFVLSVHAFVLVWALILFGLSFRISKDVAKDAYGRNLFVSVFCLCGVVSGALLSSYEMLNFGHSITFWVVLICLGGGLYLHPMRCFLYSIAGLFTITGIVYYKSGVDILGTRIYYQIILAIIVGTFLSHFRYSHQKKEVHLLGLRDKILNLLLSIIPIGIILLDNDGNLLGVNKKLKRFLDEPLKSDLMDIQKNASYKKLYRNHLSSVKKLRELRSEVLYHSYTKSNGDDMCLQIHVTRIGKSFRFLNEGYIILVYDISDVKRLETLALFEKDKAIKANMAKTIFLSNMSHELRTPLNGIIGFSELLMDADISEEHKELLAIINRSGEKLLTLVNDLMDMASIEAGRIQIRNADFSPKNVLASLQRTFVHTTKSKGLELRWDTSQIADSCIFHTDSVRLEQVISNLMGNAIKFTNEGYVSLKAYLIEYSISESELIIEVKDSGIGIPFDKQEEIFDMFVQLENTYTRHYEGSGLGLAITRKICEAMGGTVNVKSEIGEGSNFIACLPVKIRYYSIDPENLMGNYHKN